MSTLSPLLPLTPVLLPNPSKTPLRSLKPRLPTSLSSLRLPPLNAEGDPLPLTPKSWRLPNQLRLLLPSPLPLLLWLDILMVVSPMLDFPLLEHMVILDSPILLDMLMLDSQLLPQLLPLLLFHLLLAQLLKLSSTPSN